ncbi:MAG: hypothetical protein JNM17_31510 [Archangium sp.]|nr:hypothetical protein [Archangium sp.]
MNIRDRFFEELRQAIARGFTLAAVSAAVSCSPLPVPGDDGGTMAMPLRDRSGAAVSPAPSNYSACEGDAGTTGPFYGSCCTNLHCYTPTDGTCVATNEVYPHGSIMFTPSLPPGSGSCTCGTTQGPFASADGTQCCYVVGSIGCLGRPLREGESTVVAAVVARSDWA